MRTHDEKVYLGDSVYAQCADNYHITLTTENGGAPTNTIHLDPHTFLAFRAFCAELKRIADDHPTRKMRDAPRRQSGLAVLTRDSRWRHSSTKNNHAALSFEATTRVYQSDMLSKHPSSFAGLNMYPRANAPPCFPLFHTPHKGLRLWARKRSVEKWKTYHRLFLTGRSRSGARRCLARQENHPNIPDT